MLNPFQLYASYLDVVRPITLHENTRRDKARIRELEENIEILTEQANSSKHFAEMYLDIEKDFNKRINRLKKENQDLRDQIASEARMYKMEISRITMEKDIVIDKLKKSCFQINDYLTHEVNCLQAIIDGSQEEREMFKR